MHVNLLHATPNQNKMSNRGALISEDVSCSVGHLRPGAVLPALEQTVAVTGLSRLRFGQVCAGAALHAFTQPLALAVAHAQDVQRTVTRTALTGAVAPARHVPPEEFFQSFRCFWCITRIRHESGSCAST